jgi:hypothetical protein
MAAKSVTTDLTTITLMESGTTTADIGGGQGSVDEPDFYIQGSQAFSRKISGTTAVGGFGANLASTLATGDHVFVWVNNLAPGLTQTTANGGVRVAVGASTNAYKQYYVNGSEDLIGGWRCYPFDPTLTADATQGNPGTTTTFFGALLATNGTINRNNLGIDAIRYGTKITATGGGSPDPDLNCLDITAENDLPANQWGIFRDNGGTCILQGVVQIGADDTTTPTTFVDSDTVCTKANNNPTGVNQKTATNFSGFRFAGSQTTFNFSGLTFVSVDNTDKGFFDCGSGAITNTVSSGTFSGCTFLSTGVFTGTSSVTVSSCTFKNCRSFVINGSTVSNLVFEGCEALDAGTNLSTVQDCSFTSNSAGFPAITTSVTAGTYSLVDCSFSGYNASNNQADSAIEFTATTGTINVNVSGGAIPSFKTAGATINFTLSSTLTLTGLQPNTEVRVYDAGTTTEVAGVENSGTSEAFSINVSSVDIVIHALGFIYQRLEGVSTSSDRSIPIQQQEDRQFENP